MAIGLRINKISKIILEGDLKERVVEHHQKLINDPYLRDDIKEGLKERLNRILANPAIGLAISSNCSRNPYSGERVSFSNEKLVITHEGYEVPEWENEDIDYLFTLEEEDLICPLGERYIKYIKSSIKDEKKLNLILEKEDDLIKGDDSAFKRAIGKSLMVLVLEKEGVKAFVKKHIKKDTDPSYDAAFGVLINLGLFPKEIKKIRVFRERRSAANEWLTQFDEPKEIKKEEKETPQKTKTKNEVKEQPQKTKAPKFLPFKDGKELKIIS